MAIIIILLCLPANFHEKSHLEDLGGWHTLEIKNLWDDFAFKVAGGFSRKSTLFLFLGFARAH